MRFVTIVTSIGYYLGQSDCVLSFSIVCICSSPPFRDPYYVRSNYLVRLVKKKRDSEDQTIARKCELVTWQYMYLDHKVFIFFPLHAGHFSGLRLRANRSAYFHLIACTIVMIDPEPPTFLLEIRSYCKREYLRCMSWEPRNKLLDICCYCALVSTDISQNSLAPISFIIY